MLTVAEWLKERQENCIRIAKTKQRQDRQGWLEDAAYFQVAIEAVSSASPQVPVPAPEPNIPEIVASTIDEYMRQSTPLVAPNATTQVPPVAEHPDPDWPRLNRERGELITKSLDYALSGDERARLQYLTGYADARIATVRATASQPAGEWQDEK